MPRAALVMKGGGRALRAAASTHQRIKPTPRAAEGSERVAGREEGSGEARFACKPNSTTPSAAHNEPGEARQRRGDPLDPHKVKRRLTKERRDGGRVYGCMGEMNGRNMFSRAEYEAKVRCTTRRVRIKFLLWVGQKVNLLARRNTREPPSPDAIGRETKFWSRWLTRNVRDTSEEACRGLRHRKEAVCSVLRGRASMTEYGGARKMVTANVFESRIQVPRYFEITQSQSSARGKEPRLGKVHCWRPRRCGSTGKKKLRMILRRVRYGWNAPARENPGPKAETNVRRVQDAEYERSRDEFRHLPSE
ncbi:hypothetical protein B0H16DRAFT_1448131 [Mycena metata]|uniref:Uncharacterized protein n=1 Tax=Mycena metata TaxID=1033252 RepID=A0AAD7KBH7_9AGAR|nr:hypothetical protein B0H16DRAFT_1448131 [Mycena metata]